MSYVYMKALEKKAEKYDEGIDTLTRGKLKELKQRVTEEFIEEGDEVLDVGMGTGTFAVMCARKGAKVTGIDASEGMLEIAERKIEEQGLEGLIEIRHMPVIELDETFPDQRFDKASAMLVFSELYEKEQEFVLAQVHRILKDRGEFILIDEVKPQGTWKKILYYLVRIPLVLLTFLKSRLTTKPLKHFEDTLRSHNFMTLIEEPYLGNSLKMWVLKKRKKTEHE